MVGDILEKYEVLEEVGRGGMSVVYRGRDLVLDREVAIKVLHPHIAAQKEGKLRFQQEAKAVARLHHPNIIEIYDYSGSHSKDSFIVTEFVDGQTLREFLADHPIVHGEIGIMIGLEVCQALEHAHGLGIIHRDIKPENVMLRKDGLVKLTDFGIAKILDGQQMTVTGTLLGSPAHMSPEQIEGRAMDSRSDIFSVGTLLYLLTVGELPFQGHNPHELLKKIADGHFVDPRMKNPALGDEIADRICRALSRDPADRFPSISLLMAELKGVLAGVGLVGSQEEIAAFLKDPEGYQAAFGQRLVGLLLQRSQTLLLQGRHAAALKALNRVVIIDPGNAQALEVIDRVGWHRRLAQRLALAALMLVLALAGGWAYLQWEGREPPRASIDNEDHAALLAAVVVPSREDEATPICSDPDGSILDAWTAPDVRDAGQADRAQENRRAPKARVTAVRRPSPAPPAEATPPPRFLSIEAMPKNVRIMVDGAFKGFVGLTKGVELVPGEYTIRLENPGCVPLEEKVRIPAKGAVRPFKRRLEWRPATLKIQVDMPAEIFVNNTHRGHASSTLAILVPLSRPGETVEVRAVAPGHGESSKTVRVRAGMEAIVALSPGGGQ